MMADINTIRAAVESIEDRLKSNGPRNTIALLLTKTARLRFVGGAHEFRFQGIAGTSTVSEEQALESWLRAARKKIERAENSDPINLQGSGPGPIEPTEG